MVESASLLKPILSAEEVTVCVHGSYKRNLESILESGLKRMNRLHVHFSWGLPMDGKVISGMRCDVNLMIFLDVRKALEDGMKVYISENKVILTEGFDGVVPVKYFEKIESWPDRSILNKPGHHDFNLLKKLVLSDGSILRAKLPGRPTRDCLLLHLFYNYHFSFQSYFFHVIGILYMLMIGDSLSIIQRFQDYIK